MAVSSTGVGLSWQDNSTNENDFRIERRTTTGAYVQIVQISQAFDSNFDGRKIFSALVTRLEQSKKLLSEIASLLTFIGNFEKMPDYQALPLLLKTFDTFRESSLKYLMYKDWEEYENFVEEVRTSKTPESLRFTLHRFRIFLDALSGEVGKRSVLRPAVGS